MFEHRNIEIGHAWFANERKKNVATTESEKIFAAKRKKKNHTINNE